MKKLITAMCAAVIPALSTFAQVLEVKTTDADLQKNCQIVGLERKANGAMNIVPARFKDNVFEYNDSIGEGIKTFFIVFGESYKNIYLTNGEKLTITVTKGADGKPKYSYKGAFGYACEMRDSLNSYYSYPKYFSLSGDRSVALENNEGKCQMLDKYYADLNKRMKKIKNQKLQDDLLFSNRCEFLRYKVALMNARLRHEGKDVTQDEEFQKLISMIDCNDKRYEAYSLVSAFVKGKVKESMDDDIVAFGVGFVAATQKYITNPELKTQMQSECAQTVFQRATLEEKEAFVEGLSKVADEKIVNVFRILVESEKTTKAGMEAPDNEFVDMANNVHKFSDYRGKYLYVDFWATWCGPCKAEIPHLAKLVEKYKDSDKIAIISISIDANRKAWEDMITKDNPAWPQFIFNEEQSARASKDWGLNAIPRFIMLAPDGSIKESNALRPSDPNLSKLIDSLIK